LYQDIATALSGKPLVIRTLDIGGDKPLPYLPLPAEANPALGLRGVRTSLWREDLLRIQLRAILSVEPADQCRILLPMITDVAEVQRVRELIQEEANALRCSSQIQVGAMIETPAAALLGDQLARVVDFFSVGTNDLTQYTLAIDRDHAELAARLDGLHPAVLRLIAAAVAAGDKQQRVTAVCGGLASDPAAVPILLGLGVTELSVVPSLVPQLKGLIRGLTMGACKALATRALEQESAAAVRALANRFSPDPLRMAL
jgi:phosphoenolpyruvate-protein kinase (PTS system EI component)